MLIVNNAYICRDVLSLYNSGDGIKLLDKILKQIALQLYGKIDCIAMCETRGFLFSPMIALHLNVPCIPVSKKGNLPGPVTEYSYVLEYGEVINYRIDTFAMLFYNNFMHIMFF